jgi:hypothetical protein
LDVTGTSAGDWGLNPGFASLPEDADGGLTFLTYDLPSLAPVNIQSKEGAPGTGPILQVKGKPLPKPTTVTPVLAKVPECEDQPVLPPTPQPVDQFGDAVSLSGSRAARGFPG